MIKFFRKVYSKILYSITDNYILSYPKSGRTWVRYFLGQYLSKYYKISLYTNYFTIIKRHKEIPRFHFTHGNFFNESIDDFEETVNLLSNKKVLFLIRDPRDTVVSFYHHNQNRLAFLDSKGLSVSDFIRHPRLGISRIVEYMNYIEDNRDRFKFYQVVKYEELKGDYRKFEDIINFLDIDMSEECFVFAKEESEFQKMKKVEAKGLVSDHLLKLGDKKNENSYKVRKGVVGGFRDELSDEDIDFCNQVMRGLNPVFGYIDYD